MKPGLIKHIFILSTLLLANIYCKKSLEIGVPPDQLTTSQVFSDTANANSAVLGIYSKIMSNSLQVLNGGLTVLTGLTADELNVTGTNVSDLEFYANNISRDNAKNITVLWRSAYSLLYQTNACIEALNNSEELSKTPATVSVRNRLVAECKLIRAVLHFTLVNLYGAVPVITSTDYRANMKIGRNDEEDVYRQVQSDLTDATTGLPETDLSLNKTRPTRDVAAALLARVYLYRQRWSEAESISTSLIESGRYHLEADLNGTFLAISNETIWQIMPYSTGYNSTEGQLLIPTTSASSRPAYPLSPLLLSDFEMNDKRKVNNNWVKSKTVSGQTYYYPFKYKLRSNLTTPPSEYYVVFRLAEQYLIRAEARAHLNKIALGQSDLNEIRRRAGLGEKQLVSSEELLKAVYQERRTELFAEWGHRWFDLKRTGMIDLILKDRKGTTWTYNDQLFPIPQSELDTNPFLFQNPGY